MVPGVDAPLIALSPATKDDADFLLTIRNHPETRRWSFETGEILPGEHRAWFLAALVDPARRLFVATQSGILVGSARLNLNPAIPWEAEASLAVHPDCQGRGVGTAMIEALCREAAALGVKALMAHIKEGNTGSRIAFGRAGFYIEQIQDGVVTMLRRL